MTVEKKIMEEIAEVMARDGFIDSCDNTDRLEDQLAEKYLDEFQKEYEYGEVGADELGMDIRNWMKGVYNEVTEVDKSGNMTSYFYPVTEVYETVRELEEAKEIAGKERNMKKETRGGAGRGQGRHKEGSESRTSRLTINVSSSELEEIRNVLERTGEKNRANALLKILREYRSE